jgi:hypothetical protein
MNSLRRVTLLLLICGLVSVSRAFAECGPRPERVCVLANHDGPIVIATVLGPAAHTSDSNWRIHVDQSFRGAVKGNVELYVTSGDQDSAAGFLSDHTAALRTT